jgi:hypothetical protein
MRVSFGKLQRRHSGLSHPGRTSSNFEGAAMGGTVAEKILARAGCLAPVHDGKVVMANGHWLQRSNCSE